jgi:N-acetylneuraminic acid mutarotase
MGITMRKSLALLLALVFLTASAIVVAPAFSSEPARENSWVSKSSMQVARSFLGVAVVNGKIYAIGGIADDGVVGTNEEYDPATDSWAFKKPMPTPRQAFAVGVYRNKIYCLGGYTNNGTFTGLNEVYDPATDKWETKAAMRTTRIGLEATVANGEIYLIGGYVPGYYTTYNFSSSFLTLNEVYDPVADSWTTKEPMLTAVSNYASTVLDNEIFVIGGLSKSENHTVTQIYNPETDKWRLGASSPSITAYGAIGATTGVNAPKQIYLLGQDFSFREPPDINQVYDPTTDTWATGVPVPTERNGFGVAVVNDKLYVIGGFTETFDMFWKSNVTYYATNEQYTPFGYGAVPPEIEVVSPKNTSYPSGNVSLAFAVNKPVSWIGYSLDGQDNVTVTGNVTLSGLSSGLHNVTVYARDEFGNTGVSETASFTVAEPEPEPFPVVPVTAASVAVAASVGAVIFFYFRKLKN